MKAGKEKGGGERKGEEREGGLMKAVRERERGRREKEG